MIFVRNTFPVASPIADEMDTRPVKMSTLSYIFGLVPCRECWISLRIVSVCAWEVFSLLLFASFCKC